MINIKCPNCSKEYSLPDQALGKKGKCTCGETFEVKMEDKDIDLLISPDANETNSKLKEFSVGAGITFAIVIVFLIIGFITNKLFGIPVIIFDVAIFLILLFICIGKVKSQKYFFVIGVVLCFIILRLGANSLATAQLGKARDTIRVNLVETIKSQAESYYSEYNNYPDPEIIMISSYVDEGKEIKGCEPGIIYEKISDEKYKVSTCFESRDDLQKNDGGTDDLRFETGNFK